jgi:hypothetical protein
MTTPPVADRVKLPGSPPVSAASRTEHGRQNPIQGLAQPVGGRPSWSRPPGIGWAALGPRWLRPSERGLAPARCPARPGPDGRRQALVRDQTVHYLHETADATGTAARDLRHRGVGLVAKSRRRLQPVPPGGEALADRVRARLVEVTRYPAAIGVEVRDGIVTLAGPVLR